MIRQDTKDSFLSLSDLNDAYIRAREINGWADRDMNNILMTDFVIERIYYIIIEQIFNKNNENDKTTNSWFYENFKDCSSFKKYVKENGIAKVLKQLHLYRMTGRGENREVMCNPYIWVLVAYMKSNKSFTPSWVTLSSSWNINKETLRKRAYKLQQLNLIDWKNNENSYISDVSVKTKTVA